MIKKNTIFVLIILAILLLIINTISYYYINNKWKNENNKFTKETLKIYNKHLNQLHHLRDPFVYPAKEILFSSFGKGETVLIQGDSWVERFAESGDTKNYIKKFSESHDMRIIISGTSSYSPSLYQSQLSILKNSYDIDPEILVTFFDQTDIGDELCRYRNNRYYENEEVFVSSYDDFEQGKHYYMKYSLDKVSILSSKKISALKLFLLLKVKITERYFSNFKKGCKWDEIIHPLNNNLNIGDKKYITKVINEYFDYIFEKTNVKKLLIVTHAHFQHLTDEYSKSILDYLIEIQESSQHKNKISYLNFDNQFVNQYIKEKEEGKYLCIFVPGDVASHICDVYQYKIIVPNILNEMTRLKSLLK